MMFVHPNLFLYHFKISSNEMCCFYFYVVALRMYVFS